MLSILYLLSLSLLSVVAVITADTVQTWLRLRHIPGPFSAGFTNWWQLKHTWGGKMHLMTAEACEKYGSLVRIGPNDLVTSDVEALKKILGVRSHYRRSDWYDAMVIHPGYENVFSEKDDEKHNALRAKMAAAYSSKENERLEEPVNNNISKFINLVEAKYLSTNSIYKPVDFAQKIHFLTMDTITDITFKKSFGFIDGDEDCYAYIGQAEESLPILILAGGLPWFGSVLRSPLLRPFAPSEKDSLGLGKVMGIAQQVVADRFTSDKKDERDMIASFARHGLSQKEVASASLLQILAGADTTATAIRATVLYLITSPHALSRLLTEMSTSQISNPVTYAEARKLPYLQAVIREGMRVFPPVTGFLSKEVPAGGDTINGHFIPAKTRIGWSPVGLMRDPKIWGADAKVFRPERWLGNDGKELEGIADMVFGYGKWQCLGKSLAQMEINKVIVELLRRFEFELVNPEQPWKSVCAGFHIQSNMWMRITRREPAL